MNPKIITLAARHVVSDKRGWWKSRKLYSIELATKKLNISIEELQDIVLLTRFRPSWIRTNEAYLTKEDLKFIKKFKRKIYPEMKGVSDD